MCLWSETVRSTGIERLEMEREERNEERSRAEQAAQDAGEHIPGRRGVMFSETMKTLTRLSSSYRRCHWKSAAELIFPLLYEHLTFASHRTWKLFVKKAIFSVLLLGENSMVTVCSIVSMHRAPTMTL